MFGQATSERENVKIDEQRITTEEEDRSMVQKLPTLRRVLFPILNFELPKALPMVWMTFLICLIYGTLRDIKDITTIDAGGSSLTTILKLFVVTPFSAVFVAIYGALNSRLSRNKLYFTMMIIFMGYYCLEFFLPKDWFTPNMDQDETIDDLSRKICKNKFVAKYVNMLNGGTEHPITVLNSKTTYAQYKEEYKYSSMVIDLLTAARMYRLSLFYFMSEMWSSMMLLMNYYSFANSICGAEQSSRLYPCMNGIGSNLSLLAISVFTRMFYVNMPSSPVELVEKMTFLNSAGKWDNEASTKKSDQGTRYIIGTFILFFGLVYLVSYHLFVTKVLVNPVHAKKGEGKRKPKIKAGFFKSMKMCLSSKYMLALTFMVIAYGFGVNTTDSPYKKSYSCDAEYQATLWVLEKKSEILEEYKKRFGNEIEEDKGIDSSFSGETDTIYSMKLLMNAIRKLSSEFKKSSKSFDNFLTGTCSLFIYVTIGTRGVNTFGWKRTALICPIIMSVMSLGYLTVASNNARALTSSEDRSKHLRMKDDFFKIKEGNSITFSTLPLVESALCILNNEPTANGPLKGYFGIPFSQKAEMFIGRLLNASSKGLKYMIQDPVRELIFIRTSEDVRDKIKGALDVVGSRIGKSFSSLFSMIVCSVLPDQAAYDLKYKDQRYSAWIFLIVLVFLYAGWIISTLHIAKKYEEAERNKTSIDTGIVVKDEETETGSEPTKTVVP